MKKRVLSVLLAIVMVVGMFPVTAGALPAPHTHPVCGKTHTDIGNHTGTCEAVGWTAWNGTTDITYTDGTAYVYLSADVSLSGALVVGANQTLYLCLNDHVLDYNGNSASGAITVRDGGVLYLTDCCTAPTTRYGQWNEANTVYTISTSQPDGGSFDTLTGGVITGGGFSANLSSQTYYGGGVWVYNGTFYMYGGTIAGNTAFGTGGGVHVDDAADGKYGIFYMYDGTITGNRAANGGGIDVFEGTFYMYGGTIAGNTATGSTGGGGVYVSESEFHMSGGSITDNRATANGGGVVLSYSNKSKFNMSGGSITGNSADKDGGGVYAPSSAYITVSGAPKIINNTKGAGDSAPANNLVPESYYRFTVSGTLGTGASIGIFRTAAGRFSAGGADSVSYFSSDNAAYKVATDGSNLKLVALHTHNYTYSATANVITESCTCGHSATATLTATDATYTGSAITTGASVTYSDGWAGSQEHDEITYSNNLNAGTATAKVTVEGKELTTTFEVNEADISGAAVTLNPTSGTYTGTAYNPSVSVTLDGLGTLVEGTDYTLSWNETGFTNADTYTVTVTGEGNFEGTTERTFTINAANLADVKVEQVGTLTYTGEALTPAVSANAVAVNNQPITFTYSTESEGPYSTEIPSFTNAGWAHTVYYRATADNHNTYYGSFLVEIEKATVIEPTIASKPYTGSVQTADIADTEFYTIEQNNGGTAKGEYDVVLKLKDAENHKWSTTDDAEVTLKFVISAAENSWTTDPSISGWTYGQNANEPVYAAKYGTVKVVYTGKANDGSDYNSEDAPTKAGNYTATFTVAGTESYSGLSESVNFTIAKATYDMSTAKWDYTNAFKYDGKEHKVEVVGLPAGVTVGGYNGNTATVVGDYTAKVTLTYDANNYNAPSVADLSWKIENNWTPTEYEVSGSGWMNQDFVIFAMTDYRISLTNTADGEWSTDLTYSAETNNGSVTFYLRNETDGTISLAKTVTYMLDKTAPTGKVEFVDRTGWQEFVNTITFGLFYKDEVIVKITSDDILSGVAKVEYYAFDDALTLNEIKAIDNWSAYSDSFGVSVEDTKKFVYYVRITDNAGNVTYLSTNGAEYDITVPVISGIENGKTYYTTQKVTVTDKNLDTVTLNGNEVTGTVTLTGDKDVTYTIVAADKAGNSTTVSVTMKPIRELAEATENLSNDNVTSDDEQALKDLVAKLDELLADEDVSDNGERETLEQHKSIAESLLKTIDDTKAEIARIDEELNKHNGATVNSDDAAAIEQLAKDIKELLDGDNLTNAERTTLTEDAGKVADMQKTVADTVAENERISDAVDSYDLATVTSDDKADLEQLLDDINKQLESTNLTEEEISELNGDKKAVEDLLAKIKGTDELIDKLTGDVDGYSDDTVKSTDKDAIEQIIEDIDDLLETENLTEDEKKALEDAKDKAEGLLVTIDEATKATDTENTVKVEDVTSENVTSDDKTDLEKAKDDLEKALEEYGDNYTEDEKKAIEDEIKRIDDALEVIGNVEAVEELIDKLPENITKNDEAAIKEADDAYNALTDYEKSLVDKDAKKALDDAKAALAELNKPADPNSPNTGDTSNMFLWIALFFISGGAVITLTVVDRKKRMASKR